jgi:hypothetical protein
MRFPPPNVLQGGADVLQHLDRALHRREVRPDLRRPARLGEVSREEQVGRAGGRGQ